MESITLGAGHFVTVTFDPDPSVIHTGDRNVCVCPTLSHPFYQMLWRHPCVPHIHDIDDLLMLIVSVNKFDTLLNMNKPIQVFLVFQQWLRSSRLWILAYSLNLLLYRLYAL